MKKNILAAAFIAAASFSAIEADACTNFIVGKKASAVYQPESSRGYLHS